MPGLTQTQINDRWVSIRQYFNNYGQIDRGGVYLRIAQLYRAVSAKREMQ